MATINEKQFVDKISRLNNSQQSIESLSGWCTFFRKDAKRVVRLWETEFARAASIDRQLSMLYLANDILQNSRRKGPEFVNEFYHVMPRPISHLLKHGDNKVQQKVERLVAIWEERKVFGMSGTKPFTELVEAAGTPKKASGPAPGLTNGVQQAGVPPALQPIAEALSKADAAAHRSEAMTPTQPAQTGASVSELRRSQQQYSSYVAALGAETVARSGLVRQLRNLLSQQEAAEKKTHAQLEDCRGAMQRLSAQVTEAESMASPTPAEPGHQEDDYSPTANLGGEDPWDAAAVEAAPPPPPDEATAAWPASPPALSAPAPPTGPWAHTGPSRRDPRAAMGQPQQEQQGQVPAPAPSALAGDGRLPEGNTAALAAQLAAGGDSAMRLQQILANLPMEQQQAISAGLAGFVQPEPSPELGQGEEPNGGDDEYDPEDADMQLF